MEQSMQPAPSEGDMAIVEVLPTGIVLAAFVLAIERLLARVPPFLHDRLGVMLLSFASTCFTRGRFILCRNDDPLRTACSMQRQLLLTGKRCCHLTPHFDCCPLDAELALQGIVRRAEDRRRFCCLALGHYQELSPMACFIARLPREPSCSPIIGILSKAIDQGERANQPNNASGCTCAVGVVFLSGISRVCSDGPYAFCS